MSLDGIRLTLIDIDRKLDWVLSGICDPNFDEEINLRQVVRDICDTREMLQTEIHLIGQMTDEEDEEILDELLGENVGLND